MEPAFSFHLRVKYYRGPSSSAFTFDVTALSDADDTSAQYFAKTPDG
jgi:hypothetical protein